MVVIGSMAAQFYIEGMKPNDLDVVGTYDEIASFRKKFKARTFYPIDSGNKMFMRNAEGFICEADIAWDDTMASRLVDFINEQKDNRSMWDFILPSLDVLYLLKMSHRYKKDSPHFLKTMRDIHAMRKLGAKIRPEHEAFYKQRMKETYKNQSPKLNVTKKEFFDPEGTGVPYTYDHDSIHEAVKELQHPAYSYFKPDQNEVFCSKEQFYDQEEYVRLLSVLEESYVLALERSLIPYPDGMTPKEAFDMALMKVCTSITSGWFREYAWENYEKVQALYNSNYVDKFEYGLAQGIVKPFDSNAVMH